MKKSAWCNPQDALKMKSILCKLKRSLYGLKQSPRCTAFIESANFEQSSADSCLFICSKGADLAIIVVYVDDLIIVAKSQEVMSKIKFDLSRQFKMKDIGKSRVVIIDYDQQKGCLRMHQRQCMHKPLKKYRLSEAKPSTTPSDVNVKLIKDDRVSKPDDQINYKSMVGSLLYAATATRPDISHAVGAVSKFNPY